VLSQKERKNLMIRCNPSEANCGENAHSVRLLWNLGAQQTCEALRLSPVWLPRLKIWAGMGQTMLSIIELKALRRACLYYLHHHCDVPPELTQHLNFPDEFEESLLTNSTCTREELNAMYDLECPPRGDMAIYACAFDQVVDADVFEDHATGKIVGGLHGFELAMCFDEERRSDDDDDDSDCERTGYQYIERALLLYLKGLVPGVRGCMEYRDVDCLCSVEDCTCEQTPRFHSPLTKMRVTSRRKTEDAYRSQRLRALNNFGFHGYTEALLFIEMDFSY
jgi:hypothetical protein